jgi:hypothetical protein
MSSLPFGRGCEQGIDLLLTQIDVIEELVELPCCVAKVFGKLLCVED